MANIIKELIDMKGGYCIKILSDDECDKTTVFVH